MAEYRRFVAYVYEYQKGRKGTNCGFVRVEAREKECRLEVHLCCPGLVPQVRCEIFGFVRNAGLMDGSLLGSCMTGESCADCVIETERDNMGNSGVPLNAMGGMILVTENGAFFGTEWDDNPIRPDHFRRKENVKNPSEKPRIQTAHSTEKKSENTRKVPDEGLKEQAEGNEPVIHKDRARESAKGSNDCERRESVDAGNMTKEGGKEGNARKETGHIAAEEAKDSGEKGGSREELEYIVAEDAAKSLVRDQNSCKEAECLQPNLVSGENAGTKGVYNDCEKMESSIPEDLVTDKDRKGAASDYIKEAADKEKVETWKLESEEETEETEKQEIRERNLIQEGEKSKNGQSNPKNKIDPLETESFDSASGKDNAVKTQAAQAYSIKESDMKAESIPETRRSTNASLKLQNTENGDFSKIYKGRADNIAIERTYESGGIVTGHKMSKNISVASEADGRNYTGRKGLTEKAYGTDAAFICAAGNKNPYSTMMPGAGVADAVIDDRERNQEKRQKLETSESGHQSSTPEMHGGTLNRQSGETEYQNIKLERRDGNFKRQNGEMGRQNGRIERYAGAPKQQDVELEYQNMQSERRDGNSKRQSGEMGSQNGKIERHDGVLKQQGEEIRQRGETCETRAAQKAMLSKSERPTSPQKQQPKDPEHPQTPPTTQTTTNTPPHLGTPYTPFADGEIYDCRKIHPNDFRFFLPRDCGLRNNRFLQYGFQNFGHLLLGRNRAGRCVLGVPGGYDQQERFMANMFGFSYFKESGQIRLPRSRGGYWYRLINPPKFY